MGASKMLLEYRSDLLPHVGKMWSLSFTRGGGWCVVG